MNKQDRKTADRLKSALENIGVTARRAQVYDLVAAARGLRNRELLKQTYAMPETADADMLGTVAARIDADRIEDIATCAAAIALPGILTCVLVRGRTSDVSFEITFDELSNPEEFLFGPRGSKGLEVIARNIYHSRYYLDRSDGGLDLKMGNKLARDLLAAAEPEDRDAALEEAYGEPASAHDTVHQESHEIDAVIEALEELAGEVGAKFDAQEWRTPLEDAIVEHIQDKDDSCVEDMIQSSDRAELLFLFARKTNFLSDAMVTAEYNSCKPEDVNLDANFQHALSRLGYSIGEYRRFSGNAREACADLDPEVVPVARTLVSPGDLMHVIDNAGDSYFHLGLYVQVPISEILEIDTTRPLVLRNVHLCAHGPANGTHYDGVMLDEVVVSPEDGVLIAASSSPSDTCCYVNSYFHGSASNVEEKPEEKEGKVVTVDFERSGQHRLAFAA